MSDIQFCYCTSIVAYRLGISPPYNITNLLSRNFLDLVWITCLQKLCTGTKYDNLDRMLSTQYIVVMKGLLKKS